MTKVNIRRLDSVTTNDTTATQLINENFTALQTAIENTISRDGTTPNFMDADLDLNSYKIINAGTPTNNTDVITKEYFDQYVGDAPGYAAAAEQAANRASTSAQAAQGYSSVASGAADVAQRARDFIESDPGFVAVSTDLLLGEDSSIKKTSDDLTNIDTVAGSIANVNAVGTDIANVNAVADDLTNIDSVATNMIDINNVADDLTKIVAVADDLTKIDNVADDLTKIDAVADDLTNIDAVADNATNINAVAGNESNINAVNANKTNIDTVATNIADVNSVATDIAKVTAVADDLTNIDAVNANKTNINAVAGNNSNITAVANNETNINAVAGNESNINAAVANATNINTVAGDITNVNAVAGDLTNIDAASGYAAEAKRWAIGEPTEPTGGSAKYWAGQAAAGQVQADWTEADTTAKSYIKNKPTAGDNISFANNQISTVSDANPTQNSTNLVQSGGVYSGLDNLQSQIDTILLSSDVYDVVGTYTDLQNYDISTVPVNDIIKVLSDSTHSDAASYYRCVESGGAKSWTYVGSEGPYYTKSEANTLLDAKANDSDVVKLTGNQTINGVKAFSTAPQVSNNIADSSIFFKHTGLATNNTIPNTDQTRSFRVMANDASIIGDVRFYTMANGRTSGSLNCRRTINGTVVNCQLSVNVDSNGSIWTYAPTPATSDNSTQIATTAFVKNQGYINSSNLASCHVVTQTYINGTSWYRVYDDGWCEQGGSGTLSNGSVPITFLKPFQGTNYTAFAISAQTGTGFYQSNNANIINKTSTTMEIRVYSSTNYPFDWQASGYIS